MEKETLKLKCRSCEDVIEATKGSVTCRCGKCSILIKDGRLYINSEAGIGGYILIKNDEEYILVPKSELEGENG